MIDTSGRTIVRYVRQLFTANSTVYPDRKTPAAAVPWAESDDSAETRGEWGRPDGVVRCESMTESPVIEFPDRDSVRIDGDLEDVIVSLCWWDESGLVGTISEPVGRVDGGRVVCAHEEFGEFAYGPVITGVEGFLNGSPVVRALETSRRRTPMHRRTSTRSARRTTGQVNSTIRFVPVRRTETERLERRESWPVIVGQESWSVIVLRESRPATASRSCCLTGR